MFRTLKYMSLGIAALLGTSVVAEAASVGFQVRVGGGKNAPIIRLINTSTDAEITSFTMNIGKTQYNFDYFWLKSSPTMSYDMLTPDVENGGTRFDDLHATFTDFTPGKWFRIKTDIDADNVDSKENWHKILYDFGGEYNIHDNAEFHVTFSTGHELEGYLKDYGVEKKRVRYTRNLNLPSSDPKPPVTAIPLPAAAWSGIYLISGISGCGFLRKKFKRVA